ncbi:hypothetical protein [Bradyrhizobium canariense]|uniref:hypothetical protein n=1 Tax=Bradyrhizobium canariense TaxID=255045 RepID=UPI001FD8D160|nr:hypothetical protein [Bradyrhizobium canariense]
MRAIAAQAKRTRRVPLSSRTLDLRRCGRSRREVSRGILIADDLGDRTSEACLAEMHAKLEAEQNPPTRRKACEQLGGAADAMQVSIRIEKL